MYVQHGTCQYRNMQYIYSTFILLSIWGIVCRQQVHSAAIAVRKYNTVYKYRLCQHTVHSHAFNLSKHVIVVCTCMPHILYLLSLSSL